MRRSVTLLLSISVAIASIQVIAAEAQDPGSGGEDAAQSPKKQTPENKPFAFGFGASLCGEHGCGVVARLRFSNVSLDFAYGVNPVFVSYTKDGEDDPGFDFDVALIHADGGLAFFFGDRKKGFQDGIRVMGIYDNIVGPGGGIGWTRERQCSRWRNKCYKHFTMGFGAGVKVFPKYGDWVKDHFDYDSDINTSALNTVQMYLGWTLLWHS